MAESDLIRGNVDTIILKVLYEGDRYGYDLIRQINARGDGQWEIKQPTVYACLKRLEKQGFVTSYWDSAESDGGRRKYYSLTESGKEVFLKYKSEFERASSLFGGLIFDSEPTVFIHPTDDFSDVEDEGYSLPKRKPKRAPKKPTADKPVDTTENSELIQTVEEPAEPESDELFALQEQLQAEPAPIDDDFSDEEQQQPQTTEQKPYEPADRPAREALDPKQIIEQLFAAENGESYSDIQRKHTFAPMDEPAPEPPAPQPAPVQKAPPAPVVQKPIQPAPTPAPAPAPTQPTLPTPTAERPMLVPAAIKGFEPAPVEKNPVGFTTEEESPARREYKAVLGDLVDRFEVTAPDIRTARTATQEQAATSEQTAGQLGKVEQAVRDLGNDVKIRNHNNSAQEYAEKNFYYSNRLMMTHYTGMCLAMFLVGLVMFLTFYTGLNMRMKYDYVLYVCAGLLPIFMFISAVICYANNPEKTRRINVNFKFSVIIRIVIMIQVAVVIYCVNLIWGMPLSFSEYYIPSLALPLAYALFIPISEIIFIKLLKSGKYSDNRL
ncbi:MAG: PadR family transcriptional regulator [Clostridiales bacterium]|nr:PadR family transcriptional regulator [Clostridiales bacterium]